MMPIIELYYEDKDIVLKLDDTTKLTDLNQTAYIVYQDKKYSHLILKNIENVDEIELLVNNETIDIEWKQTSEDTDILEWFLKNVDRYDNIRLLKTKLENAIYNELTNKFIIEATE